VELDQLTENDLCVIRDSLNYSVQRVSNYPHRDDNDKCLSLRPIEEAREKVRRLIAATKKANHGR
jgi:predicted chitinase